MKHNIALLATVIIAPLAGLTAAESSKPNIVYILADDMGYGDVQVFNPKRGKIATPHMDKIAAEGMIFTDAHSSSSVCTPTRYGILTGRYNWRSKLQAGVLLGYSEPLIAKDRLTVPALMKKQGYTSACIGKWHLGMGIEKGKPSPKITDGPTTRGFDRYFGIAASLDMPPFAFIDNDRFTEPLTTTKNWVRSGPAAESFEAVDVLPTLARKAVEFIGERAAAGEPFFLYMPLASPHTPIVPSEEWQGKSGIGSYGDFVMETDWAVGEVLAALEKAGVAKNTLDHQRQWLFPGGEDSRSAGQEAFSEWRSAGAQGGHLRWWSPHSLPGALAGAGEGGESFRADHLFDRPDGDLCGDRG
jgi:arylsulfatase A